MNKYSNSKLALFKLECERKFFFKYIAKVERVGQAAPLIFGSAIHAACDAFFDGADVDTAIAAFKAVTGPNDPDTKKRTIATGKAIIREYYTTHATSRNEYKLLAREALYEIPIGHIIFQGRLDKIVEWPFGVTVIDHKTTSSYLASFFKTAHESHQFSGYIAILKEIHPEAYGLMVDAMHVPTPTSKGSIINKDGTTKIQIDRVMTHRTPFALGEWEEWVLTTVENIERATERNRWAKDADCHGWNTECPYKLLCEMEVSNEERVAFAKESIDFE